MYATYIADISRENRSLQAMVTSSLISRPFLWVGRTVCYDLFVHTQVVPYRVSGRGSLNSILTWWFVYTNVEHG